MWINLKISKTWIDVGVRLLISMNLLRKTRQIFHQSVLNLCFFVLFCFEVWRHRARHHLELTRSSWSGPGRFGRSAPRRCGPSLPVNLVTTLSDPPPYSLLCEQMTVNIFQKWTQSQKLCYFSLWSCSYTYPHFHSVVSSLPYCTIATFGSISEAVGINSSLMCLPSTCPGFGVDQLRDDNLETYWQSDGSQPHLVNIQFR